MLSELEKKILHSLNQDGRKSFRQVAKEVGTSSTAIYNNVKKLEKAGVIKGYIPIIDQKVLGYNITAIIKLRIKHDIETGLMEKLANFEEVRSMYSITGDWDQVLICNFKELKDLEEFLFNNLALPEIQRIVSHIVLKAAKEEKRTLV